MSGRLRFPLALVLLAVMAVAVSVVFLSTGAARAPEATPTTGESQTQADSQAQAAALTEAQTPTVTTQDVADGFQDRLVTEANGATAMAFMPDDRLLVTDRAGRVRVHEPGRLGTSLALDISGRVCSNSERGLLGIAVDPGFGTAGNNFVYLYYTFKKTGACPVKEPARNDNPVNRVSRFEMSGNDILGGTEQVLIDGVPSPNGNHNAGDLHFGNDGKLYVSIGDGACDYAEPTKCQPENDASRDRHILLGKILRINPDGTIPSDNPYAQSGNLCGSSGGDARTSPGNNCKETYAMGFRNPFRFAIDPDDASGTSLRANDVGGGRIEEVSQVRSGGDYGWNCREGSLVLNTSSPCPGNEMIGPINQYSHSTGCSSITGGAFVPNNAGWPSSYRDAYLYGDYVCNKIFKLNPNGNGGFERTVFATNLAGGGPVSLAYGPDGALYYTTYAGGGQVRRIDYVSGNKAPTASVEVTNENYGPQAEEFQFSAQKSTDPENDTLTYAWDFDYDGQTFRADTASTGATASHTYDTAGKKAVAVRVGDGQGGEDVATVEVYPGNTAPPEPVIAFPAASGTFEVDQTISLRGSASDADGQDVSLKWTVIRHHAAPNTHTHPYEEFAGPEASFSAPGPEDILSTNPDGNYLEIQLTATDAQGLSKTVSRDVRPETTNVRFSSVPTGFHLYVSGTRITAPRTIVSWEGYDLNVYAPPQRHDGRDWVWRRWSDRKPNRHTIETPQEDRGYIARFRQR